MKLIIAGLVLPVALFAGATSAYALDFIFHPNISEIGARSSDSTSQTYIDSPKSAIEPVKEVITFHRDYSLIALHFYLLDNSNSLFNRALGLLGLGKKIQTIWDEKIQLELVHKD